MKEKFESYSNLAYNVVGLVGLVEPFQSANGLVFCMIMQALGVASFTYHFYKRRPIFLFDWWAMTFVITITTGHIVDQTWCWIAVFAYQIVYGYLIMGKMNVFVEVGMAVVPCLVAIGICRGWVDLAVVAGLLGIALYIRSRDEDPEQLKFHDSWEHSVWHILTAPMFLVGWFGVDFLI